MRNHFVPAGIVAVLLVTLGAGARPALAWAHQGHILITRLAALRIMDDPTAPEDLKTFLKGHLQGDLEACRRLATEEFVGADPKDYLTGLDGACTFPDRVILLPEGKEKLEPFGVPEAQLHFIDLELFTATPSYADDVSHKPKFADIPRDVRDVRFKNAGFLPVRTADVYEKLRVALQDSRIPGFPPKGQEKADAEVLKWTGYLAHYLEDSTQPHHGTVDYKSLSYLAGKVEGVQARTRAGPNGTPTISYSVDPGRSINPHGDLEFQLFENAQEPRKTLRVQFWNDLRAELTRLDAQPASTPATTPAGYDPFAASLNLVLQSYDNLPLIGHASQAAYAHGQFDPAAFFNYRGQGPIGEESIIHLIARQNAVAVRAVEQALRQAWTEAQSK